MLSCLALTCLAFPWLDLKLLLLVSYLLNADSPLHRLQPISICFFFTTWPWCQTVDGNNFAKKIKPCQDFLCRTMFKPVTQRACDPHTPNFNVEHGTIKDSRNYFRGNDQRSLDKKNIAINIEIGVRGCYIKSLVCFLSEIISVNSRFGSLFSFRK